MLDLSLQTKHLAPKKTTARREDSYNAQRGEEGKVAPQAEAKHPASRDESPPHPPSNEEKVSERSHEEPWRTQATSLIGDDQRRRSTILEALRKGQPYKNLAQRLLHKKGQHSEQKVKSVINHVYGIDYNQPRFVFEEKISDDNKWKRTNIGHRCTNLQQ